MSQGFAAKPVLLLTVLTCIASGLATARAAERAAEHVTLTNGFDLICDHHELSGDRMRLYTEARTANFIEVAVSQIASFESIVLPAAPAAALEAAASGEKTTLPSSELTKAELHELLARAGATHNLDVDLLASVVKAESGGQVRAVSKAGARGLMQLMPATAKDLGVTDTFHPEQNIAGGTAYLDALLTRYHENLALALAAYNAGPAAVDRWHGVPPYHETRLYVARIIRDFNARVKASRLAPQAQGTLAQADTPVSPENGAAIR
jgi:soluble lytic murein transglycosylase-like protein